jgi:serine-type D-Ala-D-Ala carboxypeptidase/endopeptidase (penicillin-binding protein 4)
VNGSGGLTALVAAVVGALFLAGGAAARVDLDVPVLTSGAPTAPAQTEAPPGAAGVGFRTTSLSQRLARALAVPHAPLSRSGAVAVDLQTGRVVYALNPTRSFVPASNQKLPVTYAALVKLGASYRFRTAVLGSGAREGSTWAGDIYLHGGGDPTLRLRGLRRLAAQLHAAGIRRIAGDVLADESFFDRRRTAPGWKPSFYMNESPPLSALVVDRAQYRGSGTSDPAGAAAASFVRILNERGVRVAGESAWGTAPADAFPLAQIESAPLGDVLGFMDRDSDDFTAEMVLKTLGAELLGKGTNGAGARVVVDALTEAEIPLGGVRIVDGSGLSRLDRLTPRAIASILLTAWADDELRPVLWDSLPVAGRSGTLARRLDRRPALGAVRAKTGTTSISSALSGYVRRRFAFAVVQNGHPVSTWWAREAQDRFALALAAQ